jgi:hypothetical protein
MRVALCVLGAVLPLAASAALAIEFKPYPGGKITEPQWADYFAQVKASFGATMQELRDQRLVLFQDKTTATNYAFTAPGHPAYPAWIARRIMQEGSNLYVDQVGYFAGQEAPFALLFQQYEETNKRMIEDIKRQKSGK